MFLLVSVGCDIAQTKASHRILKIAKAPLKTVATSGAPVSDLHYLPYSGRKEGGGREGWWVSGLRGRLGHNAPFCQFRKDGIGLSCQRDRRVGNVSIASSILISCLLFVLCPSLKAMFAGQLRATGIPDSQTPRQPKWDSRQSPPQLKLRSPLLRNQSYGKVRLLLAWSRSDHSLTCFVCC